MFLALGMRLVYSLWVTVQSRECSTKGEKKKKEGEKKRAKEAMKSREKRDVNMGKSRVDATNKGKTVKID